MNTNKLLPLIIGAAMLLLQPHSLVWAEDNGSKVTPGELYIDHPTLINLGFEWPIAGDENRNARADVAYRKKGETTWKTAMPLMRMEGERTFQTDNLWDVRMPNMFAGSILDLEPDTNYEVRLTMVDPEGVVGDGVRLVTVKTRAEPKPATGGKVYHVYPIGWSGAKEPNSFTGFMCAYDYFCNGGDTWMAARPRVKAGDIILMHAGVYESHGEYYGFFGPTAGPDPVEGTNYLYGKGTAEKPIVIKAAGDGDVIFDGLGNMVLFNVQGSEYNYFEGITFRNTEIAIQAGVKGIGGTKGLTVKHSRFENINIGINTSWPGSSDFYIADNSFIGRDDPNHLQGWNGDFWKQFNGVEGQEMLPKLRSYTAVRVYGQGHVMAYNYIANFHDGLDVETWGNAPGSSAADGPYYPPREYWDQRPVAIDFYNNHMTNFHDNAIEIDGSMHNIRIMRNLLLNSASHPMCNQPAVGGPVYWIRNIVYNAPGGAARMSSGAPGVWFLNNTILTEFSAPSSANLHVLNNLILGQNSPVMGQGQTGTPPVYAVSTFTNYSESDFNGFYSYPGAKNPFAWNSPDWKVRADYHDLVSRDNSPLTVVKRSYPTLAAYRSATQHDRHSIMVDYSIFERVTPLTGDMKTIQKVYKAEEIDVRLKPRSAAIDKGTPIPQITDGFTGRAPDLGALEYGQPNPHYGPRDNK